MIKYTIRAVREFIDKDSGDTILPGAKIETTSFERVKNILDLGVGELDSIVPKRKKSGNKVIIFQKLLFVIGGIETWDFNLARIFKDKKLTFVFQDYDLEQALRIGEYCEVVFDSPEKTYECDVFISANYDGGPVVLDRVKARKCYQTIHSDFSKLKEITNGFRTMELDERFDKVIAASETAQKGLKKAYGIDSVVVRNPLAEPEKRPMVFLTLSRASEEKGIDKVVAIAEAFARKRKNFIWIVAATTQHAQHYEVKLRKIKQVILVEPSIYAQKLISMADYLCQFSLTEAYCYSMHEALAAGVPVLATKFEEAEKWIKDGKNGYLLEHDLSNFDDKFIEKVFNKKPGRFTHEESIDSGWFKLMKGGI